MTTHVTLNALLTDMLREVPGVVAMATTAAGPLYEGAAGTCGAAAMTTDRIFGLASMTKAIVSAAAMRQVDAGRLALDAPLADVLPALSSPQVLEGYGPDGTPRLRPAARPITLRHVLTHSAGFGYNTWNVDIGRYIATTGLARLPADAGELARTPLLFDPGTAWNYGINTDVAGLAIEAVTGERLDLHLAAGLLADLGMTDTAIVLDDAQRARRVTTMRRQPDRSFADIGFTMDRPVQYCMGGGFLHGTARDYLRFIRLILNGGVHEGTRLLSPASMAALTTNQLEPGVRVRRMISNDPPRSQDAEFFPGMEKHWSAGFMISTEDAPTGRRAGSLAWAGIANTYCWIDPAAGIGGVFMTQTLPFADPATLAAFARFERTIYDLFA